MTAYSRPYVVMSYICLALAAMAVLGLAALIVVALR